MVEVAEDDKRKRKGGKGEKKERRCKKGGEKSQLMSELNPRPPNLQPMSLPY